MIVGGTGLLLLVAAGMFGDAAVLASSQAGYWSSALVVAASFGSYRRMVARRVEDAAGTAADERDVIEKIEDPHDLYSQHSEEVSSTGVSDAIRAEKKRMKKNRRSLSDTARDSSAAFSLYRMVAYGVLVLGFFYLKGSSQLDIASYLLSLGLPIVLVVGVLLYGEGEK